MSIEIITKNIEFEYTDSRSFSSILLEKSRKFASRDLNLIFFLIQFHLRSSVVVFLILTTVRGKSSNKCSEFFSLICYALTCNHNAAHGETTDNIHNSLLTDWSCQKINVINTYFPYNQTRVCIWSSCTCNTFGCRVSIWLSSLNSKQSFISL